MPHHRSPYNGGQMAESFRAGLISGTGAEGLGIALRLAAAGHLWHWVRAPSSEPVKRPLKSISNWGRKEFREWTTMNWSLPAKCSF